VNLSEQLLMDRSLPTLIVAAFKTAIVLIKEASSYSYRIFSLLSDVRKAILNWSDYDK
jgi:hypothetical protein